MKVRLKRTKSLPESVVSNFESRIGRKLPEEYRRFVLKADGAEPDTNVFSIDGDGESGVNRFIPLEGTLREQQYVKGEVEFSVLPVAWAECGDYVCLNLENGEVYFWDHEAPITRKRWRKLSGSFDEFLNSLSPFDAGNVTLKPGQVREVWVDPEFRKKFE